MKGWNLQNFLTKISNHYCFIFYSAQNENIREGLKGLVDLMNKNSVIIENLNKLFS